MSDEAFEDDIHGKKAPQAEIALHSNGYKEAISKVSYLRGRQPARTNAAYISRDGELEVEFLYEDEHLRFDNLDDVNKVLDQWADRFDKRKNSRDVAKIILSTPETTDPENARNAAIELINERFNKNECLLAVHTDTNNPHVHIMLEMKDNENKKLRLSPRDLSELRQTYAKKCRDNDINVCATLRTQRGKYIKPEHQAIRYIKPDKFRIVDIRKKKAQEIAKQVIAGKELETQKWHKHMQESRMRRLAELDALKREAAIKNKYDEVERLEKVQKAFENPLTRIEVMAAQIVEHHNLQSEKREQAKKEQRKGDIER